MRYYLVNNDNPSLLSNLNNLLFLKDKHVFLNDYTPSISNYPDSWLSIDSLEYFIGNYILNHDEHVKKNLQKIIKELEKWIIKESNFDINGTNIDGLLKTLKRSNEDIIEIFKWRYFQHYIEEKFGKKIYSYVINERRSNKLFGKERIIDNKFLIYQCNKDIEELKTILIGSGIKHKRCYFNEFILYEQNDINYLKLSMIETELKHISYNELYEIEKELEKTFYLT